MPVPVGAFRAATPTSRLMVYDTFSRADSTMGMGLGETRYAWTTSNTWGVSGQRAYVVVDAPGASTVTPDRANLDISVDISGTLNSVTNYRIPCLLFHFNSTTEYLRFIPQSGHWYIKKTDGTTTNLMNVTAATVDGQTYRLRVVCQGVLITAYVDGVSIGSITLAGDDVKFANYARCGMFLSKAGSPATAASFDNFTVLRM